MISPSLLESLRVKHETRNMGLYEFQVRFCEVINSYNYRSRNKMVYAHF